jgi:dihydrolipoamide dehydrogenase
MAEKFQVVVIGAGPGGYVAAIRAAQLGFKTAIIEMEKLGGICLNWGCIPTKALLQSAHLLEEMKHANEFGIISDSPKPDFEKVIHRSRKVADQMAKGVDFLMKKNKVQIIYGKASFKTKNLIEVINSNNQTLEVESDRFIIATGARSKPFPNLPFDNHLVLSSREAMIEKSNPKKLGIIGAGAIGVEFADFYSSMGSNVEIIEYLDHLLPNEDEEISKVLETSFKKRGIKLHLGKGVSGFEKKSNSILLEISTKNSDEKEKIEYDKIIVGIGLIPNTEGMKLEEVGVNLNKGFIQVDSRFRTNTDTIYAIGDCTGAPLLAHVASMEGIKASEAIAIEYGKNSHLHYEAINYDLIPGCTYCHPEVASVGLTEKKAIELGYEIKVGRFPFSASGRAQAVGQTAGMVKIVSSKEHGEILGAHIIGASATEIISELMVGASSELTVHNLANIIHAHPTLSEGVMEAAADVLGEAINI